MTTCVDCGCEIRSDAKRCQPCFKAQRTANAKRYLCIDCGGPRSKGSENGRCRKCCYEPRKRLMPGDFATVAPTMSAVALARHYGCSNAKITRWLAETGLARTHQTRFSVVAQPPENFARVAPTMTLRELMDAFDRGSCVIKRWCAAVGVEPRRRVVVNFVSRGNRIPAPPVVFRDLTRAGQAAEYLLRFGPIYRCNALGGADAKGEFWSRSGFVLTGEEVIARAERLGWEPDAWRRIAA